MTARITTPTEVDEACGSAATEKPLELSGREEKAWATDGFVAEQIRSLVRQVFIPGWPRHANQVVFTCIDKGDDAETICRQVGAELAFMAAEPICILEADFRRPTLQVYGGPPFDPGSVDASPGERRFSRQIDNNLWFVSAQEFVGDRADGFSASRLQAQLIRLHRDFKYVVAYAAPIGMYGDAALLGSLTDGVILVLRANTTRRGVAQKAKEAILSANARLIGTVLCERTFPIPEGIYRKL